jgi:hypothetical protein
MIALALEASSGLKALAEPPVIGDRVKAQIARAARAAGISYTRAFDLWYGKARRIDAFELDAIRAAKAARHARAESRSYELTALATDLEALAERVARLAARNGGSEAERARLLAGRVRHLAAGE